MEMLTVLGLLATFVSVATPWLQQWVWRLQVETVVHSWSTDLHAARLQALRSGQALRLQRSSQCQSAPLANGDRRCGWQLLKAQGNNSIVLVNISPAQNNLDNYPTSLPDSVWQSSELRYRLQLQSQAQSFTLTAIPLGAQAKDACGSLTLSHTGERGVQNATVSAALCWER